MLFVDVIRKKRDGHELSDDEIAFFVNGLSDGSIPAEQVSALAMAVFLNSMTFAEAGTLTRLMAASGLTDQEIVKKYKQYLRELMKKDNTNK